MKKAVKLRIRNLETKDLEKASGGRGICHGYYECLDCGNTTPQGWGNCPSCGAAFDPASGSYGGGGGGYQPMEVQYQF